MYGEPSLFESTGRYDRSTVLFWEDTDGRAIAYLSRRFCPQGSSLPVLVDVVTAPGDRLDQIATRTLGDPEQAWRICDANDAMNPVDLVVVPGRTLRVPVPYSPSGAGGAQPLGWWDAGAARTPATADER
jgi:hypothetical protein